MIVNSLQGLPAFAAYFLAAVLCCVAYVVAYTAITPNRELELIRAGNPSAALSVGMSLIGFALPLASAIFHSVNLVDCLLWAAFSTPAAMETQPTHRPAAISPFAMPSGSPGMTRRASQ